MSRGERSATEDCAERLLNNHGRKVPNHLETRAKERLRVSLMRDPPLDCAEPRSGFGLDGSSGCRLRAEL